MNYNWLLGIYTLLFIISLFFCLFVMFSTQVYLYEISCYDVELGFLFRFHFFPRIFLLWIFLLPLFLIFPQETIFDCFATITRFRVHDKSHEKAYRKFLVNVQNCRAEIFGRKSSQMLSKVNRFALIWTPIHNFKFLQNSQFIQTAALRKLFSVCFARLEWLWRFLSRWWRPLNFLLHKLNFERRNPVLTLGWDLLQKNIAANKVSLDVQMSLVKVKFENCGPRQISEPTISEAKSGVFNFWVF